MWCTVFMMSFIIDFGEEPVRCQQVPTRTLVPERSPVRASSYRAESLELGNYSHRCRVRLENAALINDKYVLQGFMDSGSKCSIIRKSAAGFCQLSVQKSSIELVGFGSGGVGTKILGTSRAKIEVNKAAVELTLFVVNDSAMLHDMLIGETFLNDKLVAFVKIEDKFVIGRADREPLTSVKLPVNEQVQHPAKESVTKTMNVRKHQEELDEAAKN
jgi:hypothetical protein